MKPNSLYFFFSEFHPKTHNVIKKDHFILLKLDETSFKNPPHQSVTRHLRIDERYDDANTALSIAHLTEHYCDGMLVHTYYNRFGKVSKCLAPDAIIPSDRQALALENAAIARTQLLTFIQQRDQLYLQTTQERKQLEQSIEESTDHFMTMTHSEKENYLGKIQDLVNLYEKIHILTDGTIDPCQKLWRRIHDNFRDKMNQLTHPDTHEPIDRTESSANLPTHQVKYRAHRKKQKTRGAQRNIQKIPHSTWQLLHQHRDTITCLQLPIHERMEAYFQLREDLICLSSINAPLLPEQKHLFQSVIDEFSPNKLFERAFLTFNRNDMDQLIPFVIENLNDNFLQLLYEPFKTPKEFLRHDNTIAQSLTHLATTSSTFLLWLEVFSLSSISDDKKIALATTKMMLIMHGFKHIFGVLTQYFPMNGNVNPCNRSSIFEYIHAFHSKNAHEWYMIYLKNGGSMDIRGEKQTILFPQEFIQHHLICKSSISWRKNLRINSSSPTLRPLAYPIASIIHSPSHVLNPQQARNLIDMIFERATLSQLIIEIAISIKQTPFECIRGISGNPELRISSSKATLFNQAILAKQLKSPYLGIVAENTDKVSIPTLRYVIEKLSNQLHLTDTSDIENMLEKRDESILIKLLAKELLIFLAVKGNQLDKSAMKKLIQLYHKMQAEAPDTIQQLQAFRHTQHSIECYKNFFATSAPSSSQPSSHDESSGTWSLMQIEWS